VKAFFMSRLFGIFDENLILIIMSWLDLRDYGLLDLALTNVVERKRWMICLSSAHLNLNLRTIQCTHFLLLWLIKRKMQPEVISYNDSCAVLDDRSFVGINNKLLHTLDLSGSDITDAGLLMIAQGCPQLKDITLSYCKKISDKGLLALTVNLPGMTSIDLSHASKMTHVGIFTIAERCPALVKISIFDYRSTSSSIELNDSIQAIARGCPKLQTISISYCDWLSNESVVFLAERCKELRSVRLVGCDRVTNEAIRAIANSCPDLEKLDLGGRPRTDPSLSSRITDESFIIVGQNCSKLMDISIAYNNVTDIGIAALARGCLQLRSFSAHGCPLISGAGMMALSHGCKELRTINLLKCQHIFDDSLCTIAEGCPELTSLNLSSSEAVSNFGISCIAGGCKKLTSITIFSCWKIDDTTLIAIGSSCPNLREIVIASAWHKFSDRGLVAIARGCPALESISISDSPNITDAGVIVLAQKCLQLKSISFSSSKITDASLNAFAKISRKLQRASFYSCDCITSTGLSILAAECTQMQKIYLIKSEKVEEENLLSLRRKYLLAKTSENNRRTSVLSMLWHFISCKSIM
jgi:F-box and leucine-rich repeat protein 2/20